MEERHYKASEGLAFKTIILEKSHNKCTFIVKIQTLAGVIKKATIMLSILTCSSEQITNDLTSRNFLLPLLMRKIEKIREALTVKLEEVEIGSRSTCFDCRAILSYFANH